MAGGTYQVFIAYPSRERSRADELHEALVRGGARTFLDHVALLPGDLWAPKISAAQREARVTAVLVSEATDQAFYQNEEIAQAIALSRHDPGRHRVVPVYLDDLADPPYGLRSIHALRAPEVGGMAGVAAALLPLVGLGAAAEPQPSPPGTVRARPLPPRRSPFRPGMPLYVSDRLLGESRRALLGLMVADLDARGNVNLVGERRLGRTSMLNHLAGRLGAGGDQVVARVNLQDDVTTDTGFYGAVLWSIGQGPLGADQIGAMRLLELERAPIAPYAELKAVLRSLRRVATAIILIDELERCFDMPEGFPLPGFFDNLRSLLGGDQHGAYARAVVASRQPLATYFISRQVTSTLPGYLPVRRLELLTTADVEEVLTQDSPHRLGPTQRAHAAGLAASHPCRVQSAGEAWYRALAGGQEELWAASEYVRLSEQTCLGATLPGP